LSVREREKEREGGREKETLLLDIEGCGQGDAEDALKRLIDQSG